MEITGWIIVCPKCWLQQRVKNNHLITNKTAVEDLPRATYCECEQCHTLLRFELDVRVVSTIVIDPEKVINL